MKNILFFVLAAILAFTSCTQQKPVKTINNLKAGIKGETTASAKYAAFAQKAHQEGNHNVAKLFEAASKAESIHASNHTKVLESLNEKMETFTPEFEVKTTVENLNEAVNGESYEISTMYPQFLSDAKSENVEKATQSFTWAFNTEKKHHEFYSTALAALNANSENTLSSGYAVCPVCGNTYSSDMIDESCAFCGTSKEKFIQI